jgi:hypothetical protein
MKFPALRRRRVRESGGDEDPDTRKRVETAIGDAFQRSFYLIPDAEVLPALHALLIRAGARPFAGASEDEAALRVYGRLTREFGTTGRTVAYRIAVCAAIEDMKEGASEGSKALKPPAKATNH